MPVFKTRSALTGMQVKEAMQKRVNRLSESTPIINCVRTIIKLKISTILVDDIDGAPSGVVTKTDIMAAYYAGIPAETALTDIMIGPLRFCYPDDSIEDVIDAMQQDGIRRIFVCGADSSEIQGKMECSDIIGLLYRYCRVCDKSKWKTTNIVELMPPSLKVEDAMIEDTASCNENDSIFTIIEALLSSGLGAVLIVDDARQPKGVISKTDLNIAYIHGVPPDQPAKNIMTIPVAYCSTHIMLTEAIQQMFMSDVQQLFVWNSEIKAISGQLTISNAARHRSGTCKACIASLMLENV